MYCQSCQTKLSPRDRSCPTCGRRVPKSGDLGAGSSGEDSSRSYPLPPAQAMDDDSGSSTQPAKPRRPEEALARSKGRRVDVPDRRAASRRRERPDPAPGPARPSAPTPSHGLRPQDVLALLAEQPSLIEPGLEIYCEDGEAIGAGFPTAIGDIDLLARDDSGGWVVVGVAEPGGGKDIVGELLQRIGWVRRHLCQSGEEVRGVVLLDEVPDDLGYAAAAVSDTVEFKLYELQLTFESVIL